MNMCTFKPDDLKLCNWQYTIYWHNIFDFNLNEKVFLKSNPEIQMIVHKFKNGQVITKWKNKYNNYEYGEFYPESILQYKYASLVTGLEKYKICLN